MALQRKDAMVSRDDKTSGFFGGASTPSLFQTQAPQQQPAGLMTQQFQAGSFLNPPQQPQGNPQTLFPSSSFAPASGSNPIATKMTSSITFTSPASGTTGSLFPGIGGPVSVPTAPSPFQSLSINPNSSSATTSQPKVGLFQQSSAPPAQTTGGLFTTASQTPSFGNSTAAFGPFTNNPTNPSQSSWLTPPVTQPTNPRPINPTGINPMVFGPQQQNLQASPFQILSPYAPSPQQLAQLFIPKQILPQTITNKQLNLLNNPSLQVNERTITQTISTWVKGMIASGKVSNSEQLLNAPLTQLLPPEVRSYFPMLYQDPIFITKVPEAYRGQAESDLFENKKRSKSPPLNISFRDCRHLSEIAPKQKKPNPRVQYQDLYKEVSYQPRQSKYQNRKDYNPYEQSLKSIFPERRTEKLRGHDTDDDLRESSLYDQKEQSILPSPKQLPIIHQHSSYPPLQKLQKLTRYQLKSVSNLKIYNKHGCVQFASPINVLNKNIDQLITISQNLIEIKPPLMNERLGKGENNIYLTFYNFCSYLEKIKGRAGLERKFREAMNKKVESMNMLLVEFNEKTGDLTTKI